MVISKLSNLKYTFWIYISLAAISLAFIILDLVDLIPTFMGTKIVLTCLVIILFFLAVKTANRASKHKKRKK